MLMKHTLTILIISCIALQIAGQTSIDRIFICDTTNLSKNFKQRETFKEIENVKFVTLGDAGESNDPDKYLQKYLRIVDRMTAYFSKSSLLEIIHKNRCPIATCYAFTALTLNRKAPLNHNEVQEIIMKFAQDTISYVVLDWGCAKSTIQAFDYILTLTTKPTCFMQTFTPLTKQCILNILEIRKDFFRNKDFYGYPTDWETYKSSYLN
jgi:hypothetical protein